MYVFVLCEIIFHFHEWPPLHDVKHVWSWNLGKTKKNNMFDFGLWISSTQFSEQKSPVLWVDWRSLLSAVSRFKYPKQPRGALFFIADMGCFISKVSCYKVGPPRAFIQMEFVL